MVQNAKIFRNGSSQAVRLPKAYRFEGEEVCIKRIGAAVLLYPPGAAWDLMAEAIGQADDDLLPSRDQPTQPQRRRKL